MSVRATGWAWQQSIPAMPKLILLALADYADDEGYCWPPTARIADKCGLSRRSVIHHIGALKRNGLMEAAFRRDADGGGQSSNLYKLGIERECTGFTRGVTFGQRGGEPGSHNPSHNL